MLSNIYGSILRETKNWGISLPAELRKALRVENVSGNNHFSLVKLNEPSMGSEQFVQ